MANTRDEWNVAVATGLLRVAAGLGLLRSRDQLIRLGGGSSDDTVVREVFRYFGVRDVAVGVTTLGATRPGSDVRRVLLLQAAADATDAVLLSALTSSGRFPRLRGLGMVGLAAGTAVADAAGWWWLGRR